MRFDRFEMWEQAQRFGLTAYLAGPMADQPDHGYPRFEAAKVDLSDVGFIVFSPHDGGPSEETIRRELHLCGTRDLRETMLYRRMMRRDFGLITAADIVIVLPGWTGSNGARAEVLFAQMSGKFVFDYLTGFVMSHRVVTSVEGIQ